MLPGWFRSEVSLAAARSPCGSLAAVCRCGRAFRARTFRAVRPPTPGWVPEGQRWPPGWPRPSGCLRLPLEQAVLLGHGHAADEDGQRRAAHRGEVVFHRGKPHATTRSRASAWASRAIPGTTPPHSSWRAACEASASPRISPSLLTIATPVSSQLWERHTNDRKNCGLAAGQARREKWHDPAEQKRVGCGIPLTHTSFRCPAR